MLIKDITLTNFRNHAHYHLDCQKDTTLILGENGCGKTSVLEAIYILLRGKSFRATDPDIIKRGADFYRIELTYDTGEAISATYDGHVKTFKILDKTSHRLGIKNRYPIILFEPRDLNLISGAPSRRRDYFDRILSDYDTNYATHLAKYNKALRQRNELLKNDLVTKDSLFAWNLLLADLGSDITKTRLDFITRINASFTPTYYSIAAERDNISLLYIPTATSDKSTYLNTLESSYGRDHIMGHTTYGIHRDNFIFVFNQNPADGSASRGETRSMIIALKFIEANLVAEKSGKTPIILLDDVFSELDTTRRRCLVDNFKNHQVIITSVEDISRDII